METIVLKKTIDKYYLSVNNKITLILDSTTYYAMCVNNPNEYGKRETFQIVRFKNDSIIEFLQFLEHK